MYLGTKQDGLEKKELALFVLCLIISCNSRDDCLMVHWSMFFEENK